MSAFPNSPRLIRGGLVTMDPYTSALQAVIPLQYNPDQLSRSLQIQALGSSADGTRTDALRLRGPAVETIKLEAELDATSGLEFPSQHQAAIELGLHAQLAVLELLLNPSVATLRSDYAMAQSGTLEIIPLEQALTLFVWGGHRIVPVRITEFSITEEAFDTSLNPIRAKVSLGLRVLTVEDLGFDHPGGHIYLTYLANKEQMSARAHAVALSALGLGALP